MQQGVNLLSFREGSYFGEISLLYKIKNRFQYLPRKKQPYKLFSIDETNLEPIFQRFPEFRSLLAIRALRRQRYMRKLVRQAEAYKKL
mmetsp:Transcript_19888/g.30640  ORF Transcript_19888/g.30640 Transcript_19888/m.30640 type:complete len:88 (-) Transcript_19888:707-970(-)